MELGEKLQLLRKKQGLTQEELAEKLYVSRTAISKWESGRGYPSIDSLKEISSFFSVSIDALLSGEELILIAKEENEENIKNLFCLFLGLVDLAYLSLIFLPLYPRKLNEVVYAVSLFGFSDGSLYLRIMHWVFFSSLVILGLLRLIMLYRKHNKWEHLFTILSIILGILVVLFLSMTREPYAIVLAFLLLLVKGALLYQEGKER